MEPMKRWFAIRLKHNGVFLATWSADTENKDLCFSRPICWHTRDVAAAILHTLPWAEEHAEIVEVYRLGLETIVAANEWDREHN